MARSTLVAPEEGAPRLWLRFLQDLTCGNRDLEDYLQTMLGYCLTGLVSEKALWFFWGADADTGKSTFVKVVSAIMHDYADSVDVSAFIGAKSGTIPADLARLPGARLVTATEPAAGTSWDERRIKAITGGDEISVRFLYGQWFTYYPQFKIVIVGNHEPAIRNVDDAMLRRIHIVPVNRKVPREKQVPDLDKILVEREGPQILNWMIQGCFRWNEEGLNPPPVVRETTERYAAEEDLITQWVEDQCELGLGYEAPRQELYESWVMWLRARGEVPSTARDFKKRMDGKVSEFGIRDQKVGEHRRRGYAGIRLRPRAALGSDEFTVGG